MTRAQVFVLAILAIAVCIVFGVAAVMIRPLLTAPATPAIAEQPETDAPPTATATRGPIPTNTFTPTPVDSPTPTTTYTRVVLDTATPTPSHTPTPTPIETSTPPPTRSGGGSSRPRPTPVPTSRYPLKVVEQPLVYETKNYIFVILARVTSGDVLLPGYRMIGTHTPTGAHVESDLSCAHLCKASGPDRELFLTQEGNLVFEAFFYDTGTWSLMLVDPQGRQASEVFQVDIDIQDREWFYYHFNR